MCVRLTRSPLEVFGMRQGLNKKKGSAVAPFCPVNFRSWLLSWAEALSIFARRNERLHHLGIDKVTVKLP